MRCRRGRGRFVSRFVRRRLSFTCFLRSHGYFVRVHNVFGRGYLWFARLLGHLCLVERLLFLRGNALRNLLLNHGKLAVFIAAAQTIKDTLEERRILWGTLLRELRTGLHGLKAGNVANQTAICSVALITRNFSAASHAHDGFATLGKIKHPTLGHTFVIACNAAIRHTLNVGRRDLRNALVFW